MKITWIGQAGLLMQTEEKTILIDPYLSDSVSKVQPQNYRRVPVDKSFLSVRPNVIVITHKYLALRFFSMIIIASIIPLVNRNLIIFTQMSKLK